MLHITNIMGLKAKELSVNNEVSFLILFSKNGGLCLVHTQLYLNKYGIEKSEFNL
jgi:hypothetical protein